MHKPFDAISACLEPRQRCYQINKKRKLPVAKPLADLTLLPVEMLSSLQKMLRKTFWGISIYQGLKVDTIQPLILDIYLW